MGTQLETLLTQRGSKDWSLLSAAAINENKGSFEAVLKAVRTRLTPDQVLRRFEIWLEITDQAYPSARKFCFPDVRLRTQFVR